jgi:hypothetical protein
MSPVVLEHRDHEFFRILGASEALRIVPDLEMEIVKKAEAANNLAISTKSVKHSRAICYRISLAKSIACYHNKKVHSVVISILI